MPGGATGDNNLFYMVTRGASGSRGGNAGGFLFIAFPPGDGGMGFAPTSEIRRTGTQGTGNANQTLLISGPIDSPRSETVSNNLSAITVSSIGGHGGDGGDVFTIASIFPNGGDGGDTGAVVRGRTAVPSTSSTKVP